MESKLLNRKNKCVSNCSQREAKGSINYAKVHVPPATGTANPSQYSLQAELMAKCPTLLMICHPPRADMRSTPNTMRPAAWKTPNMAAPTITAKPSGNPSCICHLLNSVSPLFTRSGAMGLANNDEPAGRYHPKQGAPNASPRATSHYQACHYCSYPSWENHPEVLPHTNESSPMPSLTKHWSSISWSVCLSIQCARVVVNPANSLRCGL